MFAQSVVEYSALSSLGAAIQQTAYSAERWVEEMNPMLWVPIIAIVCLWLIVRRRKSAR